MPIYEFDCRDCGEPFEELVRSSQAASEVACPACGSRLVKKKMSSFSAKVGGSLAGSGAAACAPGGT